MTRSKKILVIVLAVLVLRLVAIKMTDGGDSMIELSAPDAERCWTLHERIDELSLRQERGRARASSSPDSSEARVESSRIGAEFDTFAYGEVIPFIREMRGKYGASLGEYRFDMIRARFVRAGSASADRRKPRRYS